MTLGMPPPDPADPAGRRPRFVVPPEGPTPSLVPGTLAVTATGAPGGDLVLVGAGPELGNWDPAKGVPLDPVARVRLPGASVIEYKLVVRTPGGATWEPRPNRYTLVRGGETTDLALTWSS